MLRYLIDIFIIKLGLDRALKNIIKGKSCLINIRKTNLISWIFA